MSCPWQGIGIKWFLRSPSTLTHSMILLLHDSLHTFLHSILASGRIKQIFADGLFSMFAFSHISSLSYTSQLKFFSLWGVKTGWRRLTVYVMDSWLHIHNKRTLRIQCLRNTLWHFLSPDGKMHLELQRTCPEHGTRSIPPAPLWDAHRFSRWLLYAPETLPSTHLSPESRPDSCAPPLQ